MEFDYSKLKGRIIEKFDRYNAFGDAMGLAKGTINKKLNNQLGFSQEDICKAMIILEINEADINHYFFTQKITLKATK
jgi:hypothetical protein